MRGGGGGVKMCEKGHRMRKQTKGRRVRQWEIAEGENRQYSGMMKNIQNSPERQKTLFP